jgi:soluble lytic murein transglycosylase-like protein
MTWLERFSLAVLLSVIALFAVQPARADEAISRRLAALKVLTDPGARRSAAPADKARAGSCVEGAWWGITDYGVRSRTEAAIRDASIRFATDARLIRSVIQHESAYDIAAVSHKGAMGIMQLMPATARELGVVCPFDPRQNILGGTRYLRRMYDRLGSWPRAVAAYHAGPASVESGRIPAITRRYTQRVLRTWDARRFASVHLE